MSDVINQSLQTAAQSHAEVQKVLRDEIAGLKSLLDDRFREIGALTQQLEASAAQLAQQNTDQQPKQDIDALKARHTVELKLVHALYASWRDGPAQGVAPFAKQIEALSGSKLFDAKWYLQTYPDVIESGMSPKEHYVRSGTFEGRDPGPDFSTMGYYFANPDIADTGWPALVHYVMYGKAEGRSFA